MKFGKKVEKMDEAKPVKFKVIKDVMWDNWGHMVTAFSKGTACEGMLYPDGDVVAESPYYKGVIDTVWNECIEIYESYEEIIRKEFPDIQVLRETQKPLTKEGYEKMRQQLLEFSKED